MTKSAFVSGVIVLAILPAISGCSPSSAVLASVAAGVTPAGPGGALPIKATGRALAYTVNSKNTSSINTYTNTPDSNHEITQARILEKSAPGGIAIEGSATVDPSPNPNQTNAALVSAGSSETLANGTPVVGMTDAKGGVYFDGGNFGDAQASNETAGLSSVGVYNNYANGQLVETIVLKHGTTIRYREGAESDTTALHAIGYIGNATTNMPTTGQATYRGFHEGGWTSVYDDNGTMQQLGLSGGNVELAADFGAGTVKGGITGAQLTTYKNNNMVVLNNSVTGLNINANITGAEYTGTANLVDANGNTIGTTRSNEAIGSFFGDAGAETIAAYVIEGNAMIDGQDRDYIMSGAIGGIRN